MWILENEGEALSHKRLWLRPGKRYLFGRTVAEPGQLAIQGPGAERVSRKHVMISVAEVEKGHAEVMGSRSSITIEDLGSKGGTKVNGHKYRGETCTLAQDSNSLQMGSFPPLFRITWFPVVLSFSFTSNQLRTNPFARLRESLEQLDIKLLSEYDVQLTTHVVSKKRNTPKGLQALINGRHIVNDGFVDAITHAASPEESNGATTSPLEQDFEANWPDPMVFLPPPGEEPVPRPPEAFAPNPARAQLFDGYTFIFYDKKQHQSLIAPITNGKGKALLHEVVAGETQIDDFIRYVKSIAGEKGLGEFEDGSEGRGVVVVKWMPSSSTNAEWYAEFFRSISLRLDHRLVDQKEFLDAILNNDASSLRRPLEFESQPDTTDVQPPLAKQQPVVAETEEQAPATVDPAEPLAQSQESLPTRRRGRAPIRPRFRGFAISLDDDAQEEPVPMVVDAKGPPVASVESSQGGLFVSQEGSQSAGDNSVPNGESLLRKRPAPPFIEVGDVMDDFAPTAAQVKRRRIAAGEEPVPRRETSPPVIEESDTRIKQPKVKKEIDVLGLARQHREEAEQRAKREREELEEEPGDLDLTEIRRLHIVESMPLRESRQVRTREQDIADGRWNPSWNGRKNFKKFQQRGAPQGRRAEKIIVALEEVKSKGFGIGDDYWLEDEESQQRRDNQESRTQARGRTPLQETNSHTRTGGSGQKNAQIVPPVDSSEEENVGTGEGQEDDDEEDDDIIIPSSSRGGTARGTASTRMSQTRSQRTTTQQSSLDNSQSARRTGKRPATAAPAKGQASKRSKVVSLVPSDDDSDDEIRFRFGKR
ncbi:hypothetical protein GGS20DRAFT_509489 [Poronia punctata]|nr:hypothetical protein GGS20DRAFT_509489 [Poronia punctata]